MIRENIWNLIILTQKSLVQSHCHFQVTSTEVRPKREEKERRLRTQLILLRTHRITIFSPILVQTSLHSFILIPGLHFFSHCYQPLVPTSENYVTFSFTYIVENKKSDPDGSLDDDFDNPGQKFCFVIIPNTLLLMALASRVIFP